MSLKLYYHFGFSCLLANCVLFRAMARLDQDIMRKNVKGTYIFKKNFLLTQILLQVAIIASGNYNFFNLLTVTFCISLMDDRHLSGSQKPIKSSRIESIFTGISVALLIYFTVLWFGIDFGKDVPVHSEISKVSHLSYPI